MGGWTPAWPLALIYPVFHSSLVLLVVQDLALVGAGLVALRWGLEWLAGHWPDDGLGKAWVAGGFLVALLVNPWIYWTASYDFHFQPIAVFFTLLAGRDISSGRARAWVWVAVVLLCGDVAATYIIALGISIFLAGRSSRRNGLMFVISGVL